MSENVIKMDPGNKVEPMVMASSDAGSDEIVLNKEDLDQLADRMRMEDSSLRQVAENQLILARMEEQMSNAVKAALEAKDVRDKFCLEIESKYKIPKGSSWKVSFERGSITVRKPVFTG
jgi:hypothetical protein